MTRPLWCNPFSRTRRQPVASQLGPEPTAAGFGLGLSAAKGRPGLFSKVLFVSCWFCFKKGLLIPAHVAPRSREAHLEKIHDLFGKIGADDGVITYTMFEALRR